MVSTLVTQSRMASLMASLSVRVPDSDADYLCLQQAHAEDVQGLAANVLLAHVDDAFQAEHGADGGGGDTVLPRAGLGDDALLAHVLSQEGLAKGVVDLVGAGVGQVLALQVDPRTAEVTGQVLGVVQGSGTTGVCVQQVGEAALEILVGLDADVGLPPARPPRTSEFSGMNLPPKSPKRP